MAQFDLNQQQLVGNSGSLTVPEHDEITRKLSMLIEGECDGAGPNRAAAKFGFSKQRYFQLRTAFLEQGALALLSHKRGPKTNYRRTAEVVRQVIRHRFLDPEASAEVIAQCEAAAAERKAQQDAERADEQEAAAELAQKLWDKAKDCHSHAYLERKGVGSHGLRYGPFEFERTDKATGELCRTVSTWQDFEGAKNAYRALTGSDWEPVRGRY